MSLNSDMLKDAYLSVLAFNVLFVNMLNRHKVSKYIGVLINSWRLTVCVFVFLKFYCQEIYFEGKNCMMGFMLSLSLEGAECMMGDCVAGPRF